MYLKHTEFFISTLILTLLKSSCSERLHEQIYSSIEGGAACFRRLNGTHQTGCASTDKGAVGAVHMIKEVYDAKWLTQNATAGPYIVVVSTLLFHNVIDELLEHPENLAGILVYEDASVSAFTHDSRCPNEYSSGPGSVCSSSQPGEFVWNPNGSNLLNRDIPFPVFYLPESRSEEITKIEQCYQRYNSDRDNQNGRPLCSIQLHSFMFAAVNTVVCLRRSATTTLITPVKVCDPLGDINVYSSLFPRAKETKSSKKPVILVTARIDTASMFDGISPSAASSVVGMVSLITAATALSQMAPQDKPYDRNVIWTLFNGEAFDYIGSQKVAYDISRGAWPPVSPLTPSDIPLHLEIGQIGGSLLAHKDEDAWPFYAFAPSINVAQVSMLVNDLTANLLQYNMSLVLKNNNNVPPSSLHSFRRILTNVTESGALTEVLIVDHAAEFTNMFYNSVLDEYTKIGFNYHNISIGSDGTFISTDELIANGTMKRTDAQVKIAYLATSVARTLYKEVFGEQYMGNVTASAHLVDEMLYCFLRSQACRLLLAADYAQNGGGEDLLPDKPAPLYVGVNTWPSTAPVFAAHLLALLTGQHLAGNRTQCEARNDPDYSYYYLKGWNHTGVCVQTTMNVSKALSPAFTKLDYDFASGEFSTWTESVWQTMWARVFVAAGGGGARAAAAAGAAATALAGALTYWLQRHSQRIFLNSPAGSLVGSDAAAGILRTVNC